MVWWIVVAVVVFGIVLLALAALPVLRRLPGLRRAMARAQRRATELQGLQASVEAMQERVAELAARTGEVTVRNARRG